MDKVLIIGGGLAGCTAALELADGGREVIIVEKERKIGGKVRNYGCKATVRCNNCGLCLSGDVWEQVESSSKIRIIAEAQLSDLSGTKGSFKAAISKGTGTETINDISSIIVAAGFTEASSKNGGSIEVETLSGIMGGLQLEKLLSKRDPDGFLPESPSSVAFIQCYGSRDIKEKAQYCSKVCCGYSTRAARVLKSYYPDIKITFFYMDMQQIDNSEYFKDLLKDDMEFIKCRPVKIKQGNPPAVVYEKPGSGGVVSREFGLIVLSEGIRPSSDLEGLAEICTLGIDKYGFLKYVTDGKKTGIYIAGCASGPKKIEEVFTESIQVAREILED